MDAGMLILGAGEAGARAAATLRDQGYAGPVTMIGDEPHAPYERPPLSKAVMAAVDEPAVPTIGDTARFDALGILHLTNVRAVAIDRAARTVRLADGRAVPYARLLLATGAQPRRLAIPGGEAILYLRTFADALALRARLKPGGRIVVIGGGLIGLEIAASAIGRGCTVTVVEAAPRILGRGVPAEIAEVMAARHRRAGVDLRVGVGIARIDQAGEGAALVLADGGRIAADGVVAGIGAVPETGLAAAAGLAIDNGIACDDHLMTSDADIFAAGDCCSLPHPLYAHRRVRLEAWRNAQDQGAFAAKNMLGAGETYGVVPWFWSDQYDMHLQIAGLVDEGHEMIARDLGDGARIFFHLAGDGRLVAASGVGPVGKIARDLKLAEMLIARRATPDRNALASPSAKLKALLAA
jgi:3-phenylpropionate/trans-cinnamate dioxygenase ferredoxin reductase subunit